MPSAPTLFRAALRPHRRLAVTAAAVLVGTAGVGAAVAQAPAADAVGSATALREVAHPHAARRVFPRPHATGSPTATPTPAPTTPAPSPTAPAVAGQPAGLMPFTGVRLAADNVWQRDVRSAPVSATSDPQVRRLVSQVTGRFNGVAAFNARDNAMTEYVVPAGTPRQRMGFTNCQNKDPRYDMGLYQGPAMFANVPIPADLQPGTGVDHSVTIYDPAADQVWTFWEVVRDGSGWAACWGGRIDEASKNLGYFVPGDYGAAMTGLLDANGVVTLADVRRGYIDHAITLQIPETKAGVFSYPAQRTSGFSDDPAAIMGGARIRLDPSLDLSRLGLTPVGRMVAEAAQRYGFIVTDNSGSVTVMAESSLREQGVTGVDPWAALLRTEDWEVLRNFPWEHVQVLQTDWR